MPTGLNLHIAIIGHIKCAKTRRNKHPLLLCILKYLLSTDFNDALLTKFLIQQHRGVSYLKEQDIFMSTTGHCLELKRI